ncbi:hypothetical protein MAJ_08212, partial [Metarhizium majus ARSEF 297]
MDPQTGERKGYNLSVKPSEVPDTFLQTVCSELYVELLNTTRPEQGEHEEGLAEKKQAANHAAFKIIFADGYETSKGMRLEIYLSNEYESESGSIDGRQVIFEWGDLIARPFPSSGHSSKSLWTGSLPIDRSWTVGAVIRLLLETKASRFQFVCINNKYFGCRDWITQAIYLMHKHGFIQSTEIAKVLAGPDLQVTSIYEALGLRFDYRGRISASPIDKGRFPDRIRHQSPLMPYQGSQRALELAELIARSPLHVSHGQNLDKDIGQ